MIGLWPPQGKSNKAPANSYRRRCGRRNMPTSGVSANFAHRCFVLTTIFIACWSRWHPDSVPALQWSILCPPPTYEVMTFFGAGKCLHHHWPRSPKVYSWPFFSCVETIFQGHSAVHIKTAIRRVDKGEDLDPSNLLCSSNLVPCIIDTGSVWLTN